ncbi:hypothetical protein J4453_01060 [Candidatus Woesearchaeota archaeon]|nr:hypothetical protein [Candidatus Woesearchaeota archaeon]
MLLYYGKKGQGISITTVVIAALALVVLVVIIAVFTGRIGGFSKSLDQCPQACIPRSQCAPPNAVLPGKDCGDSVNVRNDKAGQFIYLPTGSSEMVCCLKLN